VAFEEVLFQEVEGALDLALGTRPPRLAGDRLHAVMPAQRQKLRVPANDAGRGSGTTARGLSISTV